MPEETSFLLILEDGRILARNVTPMIAGLLLAINPGDLELACRVGAVCKVPDGADVAVSKGTLNP